MKTIKFKTDNGYKMFVCSPAKLSQITDIEFDDTGAGWPTLSPLIVDVPNTSVVKLIASHLEIDDTPLRISDLPFLDFFIRVRTGQYYQVAGIFTNKDDANQFMLKREDVAFIDTVGEKELPFPLYIVASLNVSKLMK